MNVKNKLRELNLSYRPRLSQNFLRSESMIQRIVDAADISETDVALEIGTGLGILTAALEKKAKKVISFETDQGLISQLP